MDETVPVSRSAIAFLQKAMEAKNAFIDANEDPDGDEPKCGYRHWDEKMADYREEIDNAAESLLDSLE